MVTDHSGRVEAYLQYREVGAELNNRIVMTIAPKTMLESAARLGFLQGSTFVFEAEDEKSILMDYALYHPEPDGRNAVAKFLAKTPPPAVSAEMVVLRAMTRAYYSLFRVVAAVRGVGVEVLDVLRDEPGFIMDVGIGTTARPGMALATRVLPMDGFLMTTGAGIPLDGSIKDHLSAALLKFGPFTPEAFRQISPQGEAEFAAEIIRASRTAGMISHVRYAGPSELDPRAGTTGRRPGRNEPCPCGSGKKFKNCHGGHVR